MDLPASVQCARGHHHERSTGCRSPWASPSSVGFASSQVCAPGAASTSCVRVAAVPPLSSQSITSPLSGSPSSSSTRTETATGRSASATWRAWARPPGRCPVGSRHRWRGSSRCSRHATSRRPSGYRSRRSRARSGDRHASRPRESGSGRRDRATRQRGRAPGRGRRARAGTSPRSRPSAPA